jgi:catechol 2,3-dioxygenase-like lactoylglutathione lyase family enzyme
MGITIHSTFLPHIDPDTSLAFYRDTLGFEVRGDVGYGEMRWITVGPADRAAVRRSRLRLPRSRRQPDPHQRAPLSHPAIAAKPAQTAL